MNGTPTDLAGLVRLIEEPSPRHLPAVVVEGVIDPDVDAFDRKEHALKVWPVQIGFAFVQLAIRSGDRTVPLKLTGPALRALAADLVAKADLIDPNGATT